MESFRKTNPNRLSFIEIVIIIAFVNGDLRGEPMVKCKIKGGSPIKGHLFV